ncbi:hypothetical protein BDV96DRAFT_685988 [Lophiotrema nucula]|uniref:Uncharacterized protein n=1 Tax=Lophiotrema nucula TaxID=690887 RepID=A0A6A5ZEM8_9PLEO|nr:hypothetical protein BDV96DRAFT_685988 [Lophiotrema nucula]
MEWYKIFGLPMRKELNYCLISRLNGRSRCEHFLSEIEHHQLTMETLKWENITWETTPEDAEKPVAVKMRERFTDIFTRKDRTSSPTPSNTSASTPVTETEESTLSEIEDRQAPKRTLTDTSLKVQDSLRNFRRASGEFLSFTIPVWGVLDEMRRLGLEVAGY